MLNIGLFAQKTAYKMLVGTYTEGQSEGIYKIEFDEKGKQISKKLLAVTDNPSFLAFSPDKNYLYAVNESGVNSAVSAFKFDKENETLTLINRISLNDAGPCYVSVSKKHVFTANYGNGTISVLKRNSDGSLTDTIQTIVHTRKIYSPRKFGASNVHQTLFSPDGNMLIVTNLGKDCIYSYKYNPNSEKEPLELIEEKILTKHSGPRHAVFTKNGKYLYLLNELNASLTAFEINKSGSLSIIQTASVVNNQDLQNGAADIHLSPDEKYLYATNRGEANDITCFKTGKSGKINKEFSVPTGGNSPRNFAISPDGKFLFVGNQKSNNITVFRREKGNGNLHLLDDDIKTGSPVCLLFY